MLIFGERHLRLVTRPTTTGVDPIAAANSAARPDHQSPACPGSGSSADPFSAASSANTSGLRRSPGQDRWPTSNPPPVKSLRDSYHPAAVPAKN